MRMIPLLLVFPLISKAAPSAVVLLGPSGSGKSETSNTLVGGSHFKVSAGLESETLRPQAEYVTFVGREWQVIDTPGYFDTSRSAQELEGAIAQFADMVKGKVALLAFVVPYGRFGDAHLRGWRLLRSTFGEAALKHTALVFTSTGTRTEVEVEEETKRLCSKSPPPTLCSVLSELGGTSEGLSGRLVAFGQLEQSRKARDRARLFQVAAELERLAGGPGHGYDPATFASVQAQKKLLARRVAAVSDPEERRLLEMLLQGLEAGGSSEEEELRRRLERAEGAGESEQRRVDFEDRTLGPFQQVGTYRSPDFGWRRPMPIPYTSIREFAQGSGGSGGQLLLHTGTDSGVRLRHGDRRIGELRSEPFFLGRGEVSWEGTGAGGFIALCRADADLSQLAKDGRVLDCLEKRVRRPSATLVKDGFSEEELQGFLGAAMYLRIVDDKKDGWGFLAFDNIAYPIIKEEVNSTSDDDPSTAEGERPPLSQ